MKEELFNKIHKKLIDEILNANEKRKIMKEYYFKIYPFLERLEKDGYSILPVKEGFYIAETKGRNIISVDELQEILTDKERFDFFSQMDVGHFKFI